MCSALRTALLVPAICHVGILAYGIYARRPAAARGRAGLRRAGVSMSRVLVFGSINMDLVVETGTFPRLGKPCRERALPRMPAERARIRRWRRRASAPGSPCSAEWARDAFGTELKARLAAEGVGTRWVQRDPEGVAIGIAAITVCNADNAIVVVPGANAHA